MNPNEPAPPAIELSGIDKRFGAVHANKAVSLKVAPGTIHGIVGENGAGKSTLMSILYGFYQADAGAISVGGKPIKIKTPSDAIAAGIGMVHQHFMLVEPFTVLENVVLGAEGGMQLGKGVAAARIALEQLGKTYSMTVPLDTPVSELAVGVQQRVEILKALYRGADILILDEPTGVLTPAEADHLFKVLAQLRNQGKTVLFITHKLREIMAITDNVSVMRRGEIVGTVATKDTTPQQLAEMMVGRSVRLKVDKAAREPGAVVLDVRNLSALDNRGTQRLRGVSFSIREGEIVGIAGVAGNGQSELLEVLAGIRRRAGGEILLGGTPLDPTRADPAKLRRDHVAHVPEDRHRMGLVMSFAASENCILGYQADMRFSPRGFLDRAAIVGDTTRKMADFDVRPADPALRAALFSGGNQQKLVLAREFERDPRLLIVGQPTRGVDIGAIEFIHKRLIAMRDAGKAILLVSVELDEIRALADRILVMFDGHIVGKRGPEASENELGLLMAGIADGHTPTVPAAPLTLTLSPPGRGDQNGGLSALASLLPGGEKDRRRGRYGSVLLPLGKLPTEVPA
jgi:general nucleoside transport system ATP-binding protein